MPRFFYFEKERSMVHWVQSEYARKFIRLNGVPDEQIRIVGDYLNLEFLQKNRILMVNDKERWVLYNPKKGYQFTARLIQAAPDIKWIPLENMTLEEVHGMLSKARVYIDFGNHPGKDRIPREAAISGCCILTSKRGAAANDIDVPISSEYKFEDTEENIPAIIQKIRFLLENYETETLKFEDYRHRISNERKEFTEAVEQAFQYERLSVVKTALLCSSESIYEENFLQDMQQKEGYRLLFLIAESDEMEGTSLSGIPFISTADAAFLYQENRIDKIVLENRLLSGKSGERTLRLIDGMKISYDDCILVSDLIS